MFFVCMYVCFIIITITFCFVCLFVVVVVVLVWGEGRCDPAHHLEPFNKINDLHKLN